MLYLRKSRAQRAGFSLIETMMVLALITTMLGIGTSAFKGFGNSGGLTAGSRTVAGLLTVARSEAIARHALVRFAVTMPMEGATDGLGLRRMSLWAWDAGAEAFIQISKWEELPEGVSFEPQLPDYVQGAAYAEADRSTVKGECVLDAAAAATAEFTVPRTSPELKARYVDFLPSGNVRVPGGETRRAIFVLAQGKLAQSSQPELIYAAQTGGKPSNWAQINVETLTGRVRLFTP